MRLSKTTHSTLSYRFHRRRLSTHQSTTLPARLIVQGKEQVPLYQHSIPRPVSVQQAVLGFRCLRYGQTSCALFLSSATEEETNLELLSHCCHGREERGRWNMYIICILRCVVDYHSSSWTHLLPLLLSPPLGVNHDIRGIERQALKAVTTISAAGRCAFFN